MDQNRLAQLALNFIPKIGSYSIKQLISYCGSANNVFNTPKGKLLKIPGIGPATANLITTKRPFDQAEEELKRAEKENVRILFYTDKSYPNRLKHISDAPSLLYFKGSANLNASKIVAIVGTRNATPYGKELTEQLIKDLKTHQVIIVSGLAYGIDICAHRAALTNGIPTIGVMASGMNVIYPTSHREAAKALQENGGLLTEHSYDVKPDPHKFPARNRIIAGMSDIIVVAEAAKRGGALITAELGNGYNRDVFAFPGNLGQPYSEGCNNLIKQNKASLLTGIEDIEYIMRWERERDDAPTRTHDFSTLNEGELTIVNELMEHVEGIAIDNLSWKTQLPTNKLASILLNLEFQGFVTVLPGKLFKLKMFK